MMRKFLLNNLLLPAASKFTSNRAWNYYHRYIESEFDPVEMRKQRQWEKMKKLIDHAYRNVPFYRRKFDNAGIRPDDLKDERDFRRIPITTKNELRGKLSEDIIASNYPSRNLRFSNTSGTTGASLILMHDHEDINYKYASKLRSRNLMGCDVNDSVLRIAPNECRPCLPDGKTPDINALKYLSMV